MPAFKSSKRTGPHRRGELFVFAVEVIADLLENHLGIGFADRIEAVFDEFLEEVG